MISESSSIINFSISSFVIAISIITSDFTVVVEETVGIVLRLLCGVFTKFKLKD